MNSICDHKRTWIIVTVLEISIRVRTIYLMPSQSYNVQIHDYRLLPFLHLHNVLPHSDDHFLVDHYAILRAFISFLSLFSSFSIALHSVPFWFLWATPSPNLLLRFGRSAFILLLFRLLSFTGKVLSCCCFVIDILVVIIVMSYNKTLWQTATLKVF